MAILLGKSTLLDCIGRSRSQRNQKGLTLFGKHLLLMIVLLMVGLNYTKATSSSSGNSQRIARIINRRGKYLSIKNQKVEGTALNNPYAELKLYSSGFHGKITIKGIKSNKFIAINNAGKIYLTMVSKRAAVFIDLAGKKGFRLFKTHSNKYLKISQGGVVSITTDKNNKGAQFAIV